MNREKGWSVVFEFDDVGYVKDDDKDELNADKMMKMFKDNEPAVNEARKEAGLSAQHTLASPFLPGTILTPTTWSGPSASTSKAPRASRSTTTPSCWAARA